MRNWIQLVKEFRVSAAFDNAQRIKEGRQTAGTFASRLQNLEFSLRNGVPPTPAPPALHQGIMNELHRTQQTAQRSALIPSLARFAVSGAALLLVTLGIFNLITAPTLSKVEPTVILSLSSASCAGSDLVQNLPNVANPLSRELALVSNDLEATARYLASHIP